MSTLEDLIENVRARELVWRRDPEEWLPSAGSGGAVPWSWTAAQVCSLLGDYQGGVTRAVLVSELQRRWAESKHAFGRTMAGRAASLEALQQEGGVPPDAVLEVRLGAAVRGAPRAVALHELRDWRGGRLEAYLPASLAALLEQGLVRGEPLLRLTGLRCAQQPGGGRRAVQLLPTPLFTVLVESLEELAQLRDRCEGCMWARVAEAGRRRGAACEVGLVGESGVRRRLLLEAEQGALAQLLQPGDTLLLLEPVVGRGDAVELGGHTVLFQHPHDPLAGAATTEDWTARRDRPTLRQLLFAPGRCATLLVRVETAAAEAGGGGATLRVTDASVDEDGGAVALHCWGESGAAAAARRLEVGQWVLLQGALSRRSGTGPGGPLLLHCDSDAWGGRLAPLPLAGLLASPGLWQPAADLGAALEAAGGAPAAAVALVAVRLPAAAQRVCVRLDDGRAALWAEAGPAAEAQLRAAAPARLSDVVGSRWHVWLARPDPAALPRIDCCVPLHPPQHVAVRLLQL